MGPRYSHSDSNPFQLVLNLQPEEPLLNAADEASSFITFCAASRLL
jgi:hypothetical protein